MIRGPLYQGPLLMVPVFAEDSQLLGYLRLNEQGIAYVAKDPEEFILTLQVDDRGKLMAVRAHRGVREENLCSAENCWR